MKLGTVATYVVAVILGVGYAVGQLDHGNKVDAQVGKEGDILYIPVIPPAHNK